MSLVQLALRDFLSLLMPRSCAGCRGPLLSGETTLCTRCLLELPRTGYLTDPENPVFNRFVGRIPVLHAWAFVRFQKHGLVQRLIHQLKYNHHPEIGVKLGTVYAKEIAAAGFAHHFDCIIPVPLHPRRQRARGYNQSKMIAEGISRTLKIPVEETVSLRQSASTTQTRKSRRERWENVRFAFSIAPTAKIEGKRILLVDDVITTGATLEACGQHLLEQGCTSLSIACLAEAR